MIGVRALVAVLQSFNPLPPPKRGEMHRASKKYWDIRKFQSAPPAEARGDPSNTEGKVRAAQFQSAPPAEARGDWNWRASWEPVRIVSIRSPRRSEGRCRRVALDQVGGRVSIRSPRRSEGRYHHPEHTSGCLGVSIRSPRRSEGRCAAWRCCNSARRFQSAPPAEARGDIATRF